MDSIHVTKLLWLHFIILKLEKKLIKYAQKHANGV